MITHLISDEILNRFKQYKLETVNDFFDNKMTEINNCIQSI